jgi:hypothetical protein
MQSVSNRRLYTVGEVPWSYGDGIAGRLLARGMARAEGVMLNGAEGLRSA